MDIAAPHPPDPPPPSSRTALIASAHRPLFLAVVTLLLITPSLTSGPFNWLPVIQVKGIARSPVGVGPLASLPALAIISWIIARLLERPARQWRWGRGAIVLPLAGLTLLMASTLEPRPSESTVLVVLSLGLLWWVYTYTINEKPDLQISLTLIVLVQASVAVGQFALQRDLGLQTLGEPVLNPQTSGTCVLLARNARWLRAYGLSGHPNLLGPLLAISLLLLIDDAASAHGWRKVWFTLVGSVGLVGLLTTFSRAAWLAFGVGLCSWGVRQLANRQQGGEPREGSAKPWGLGVLGEHAQFVVPILLAAAFGLLFRDLIASRFLNLETPIEARSIRDRRTDTALAFDLIRQHPWTGVGVGNYLPAVRAIQPDSRIVHNVPLLVAAELGLPGAALWAWVAVIGLTRPSVRGWAPWIAMVIAGLFDIALFPTSNWFAAVIFGLLSARFARDPSTRAVLEPERDDEGLD